MSQTEITFLNNRVNSLSESIKTAEKNINGLKLDYQGVLKSNPQIRPGISCKIVYDSHGLVLEGRNIDIDDLPEIPVGKINGLSDILNSKLDPGDIREIKANLNKLMGRPTGIPGTGIKVNYDENGLIMSSSELIEDDIPEISISKIKGLSDRLSILESMKPNDVLNTITADPITPGTHTKITYNSDGRVVAGSNITIDDIPIDLINRIGYLENQMSTLASQESLDGIHKELIKKLPMNTIIPAGTFTKVKVDQYGLVTQGSSLTINDLPTITIQNIPTLDYALRSKVEQSDFIELVNTVSSLAEKPDAFEIVNIHNQLKTKASQEELKTISNQIVMIDRALENITARLPSDRLSDEIRQLTDFMTSISGRISILEEKMSFNENLNRLEGFEEGQ